jgi:NADH-quinone oxidoreductase subunit J
MMTSAFFWFFSALMLGFGVAVIANRNPVASALSLVMSFLGLAALFFTLDAYFIGIIQVLVYAGAVMVLFLFIIMLLDLKAERTRKINPLATVGGAAVALGFATMVVTVIHRYPAGNRAPEALMAKLNDAHNIGMTLFTTFNLPFQVIGVLLLVASIGVVVLSKRELK